jgi:cytochrome c-type biogenesis protein CcmH
VSRQGFALVAAAAVAMAAVMLLLWAERSPQPPPQRSPARVVGRVELAPGAALPAWPTDATVVVYAYALDGPRLPLAVVRRPATSLPADFTLDDSLAPNPAFRISQAPRLIVGARLGLGDAPIPRPGDWVATSQIVAGDASGIRLVLLPPRP